MKYEFIAYLEECFTWARVDGRCWEYDFRKAELAIEYLTDSEIEEFMNRQDEDSLTWEIIEDFDFFTRIVLDYSIRK